MNLCGQNTGATDRGNVCMSTDYQGFRLESLEALKEKLTGGELETDEIKELSYAIRIWLELKGKSDPLDNHLNQIKIKAIELQIEIFKIWILDQKNGKVPYEGFSNFRDLPQELISAQNYLALLTGKPAKQTQTPIEPTLKPKLKPKSEPKLEPKEPKLELKLEQKLIEKPPSHKLKSRHSNTKINKEKNNWLVTKWRYFRKKYLSESD